MSLRRYISFFLCLAILLLTATACGNSAASPQDAYNSPSSDEIHIGVVYPVELDDKDTYFYNGIELAVNTINQNGGVLGKPLRTVVRDDRGDTHVAMQIAETFYEQGLTAVIGHWSTNICYFVADIYEENKVVMVTPDATGTNLFEHEYQYVFRMIANNQVFAEALAEHMEKEGLKRVAVYYSDDEYGDDFSGVLEKSLSKRRIEVIDRVTSITSSNIKTVMERWKAFGCDGLVIAANPPDIIEPIQLVHGSNNQLPVFGADNFDRVHFTSALERFAGPLYMASYRTDKLDPAFLESFRAAYGHDPDIHSITGYEAVYLLKDAIEASGSIDGAAIAEYLSQLKDYEAVSGRYSYNPGSYEFEGFDVAVRKIGS